MKEATFKEMLQQIEREVAMHVLRKAAADADAAEATRDAEIIRKDTMRILRNRAARGDDL